MIAEIAEAALGFGLLAASSPLWVPYVARLSASYKERVKLIAAQQDARDSFVPIQQKRAEELSTLVHRQEVAKHTAYAIQSEAALAVTEATIEKALSSGDLSLAKQGIQLALPPAPNGAYAQPPTMGTPFGQETPTPTSTSDFHERLVNAGMQQTGVSFSSAPFQGNGSEFYLSLLRGSQQSQSPLFGAAIQNNRVHATGTNGAGALRSDDATHREAVDGELLPPEPVDSGLQPHQGKE